MTKRKRKEKKKKERRKKKKIHSMKRDFKVIVRNNSEFLCDASTPKARSMYSKPST